MDTTEEAELQSKLNYLKHQLSKGSVSRKRRKQFEYDLELTALELGKLKISNNKQLELNVIYNPKDPPLPSKQLQTSNLELFSLNEINAEKTEKGLHKKVQFLHSKSIHNLQTTDHPLFDDDDVDDDEFENDSNSSSSSSKSSDNMSFEYKQLNFDHLIEIDRIDINIKNEDTQNHHHHHHTHNSPKSLKKSHSLPIVPTTNHNDYTLQQFSPPNQSISTCTNWWIDRLYDVNGFFVYQPQSLCMPMIPRLYGDDNDAYSELLLMNERYSDHECDGCSEYESQPETITSARSEPESIRRARIRKFKPKIPKLNLSSDSNSTSNSKRSESPPLWIEPKVNDEISPDNDSGVSLHDVIDEKRRRKSERRKRKQKLIEKLNKQFTQNQKCKDNRTNHGKRRYHKRTHEYDKKRSQSVDGRLSRMTQNDATNPLNKHEPVTKQGISKREKFRRQYAHLLSPEH